MNHRKIPRHVPHIAEAAERNIKALREIRKQMDRQQTLQDHIANTITSISGNVHFVYVHLAWFGVWVLWNTERLGLEPFDPFPLMTIQLAQKTGFPPFPSMPKADGQKVHSPVYVC